MSTIARVGDSTDPLNPEFDGDGLNDGDEETNGSDPNDDDTDNDGNNDGDEIENGTDPNDSDSDDDELKTTTR